MEIGELSIKEKVSQKFIFGINSDNIDVIIDLIKNYGIGGVILYKKNYNSYEDMLTVIKRLKEANNDNKIPLFIAVDQEGGRVNRMPSEFKNLKNMYDLSRVSQSLVEEASKITGKMLKDMGINMNFAPVMDLYDNKSKVLHKRCFYGTEEDVYRNGISYVNALKKSGIIPVLKHFPGHGASKVDSHFFTPYIYDYKKILDRHMIPFIKCLDNNNGTDVCVDAMMVNHMVIRNLTNRLPASISKYFIKEYIRDRYNYSGLVITDDINMLSRNLLYRFDYVKKAFLSGSDIILVRVNKDASGMIDKCIRLVNNNKDYLLELDNSVNRIIKIKEKYNVTDDISIDGCKIDLINKEIDKINKKFDMANTND